MTYCFPPAPSPALPIANSASLFPVRRVFCVGRNYAAHAAEMGNTVDREAPWYFTKSAHHVTSAATVPIAAATSNYHHEVELVVALKDGGSDLGKNEVADCIFGHAIGLDMTRRDVQANAKLQRRPWDTAKDVEDSAIIGPITQAVIYTPCTDDILQLKVNNEVRQAAPLSDMVWSVHDILQHLSTLYRLQAGDLIMTGTPAGVGPVVSGDHLLATCAGLQDLSVTFE